MPEFRVVTPGLRLDQFLAQRFRDLTRSYCKDLIERGLVRVGGVAKAPDYRLMEEDIVTVSWPQCPWKDLPLKSWILFEDPDILVLNKPSGLLMHPLGETWLSKNEAATTEPEPNLAGLIYLQRPAIAASGVNRCGLVHRLDRETSGVLIVAKKPRAQEVLVAAFEGRRVEKIYRAIVLGALKRSVEVEAPVGRLSGHRRIRVTPWGKEASTAVTVLEKSKNAALIEAKPLTGRTHQIRAHLAHVGHPVLGDPEAQTKDGPKLKAKGLPVAPRLMLHAYRVTFAHPKTGKQIRFTARLPKDFKDYWKSLL